MDEPAVNPARRLLVLGGGYTGQRFARAAAQRGFELLLSSRQPRPAEPGLRWLLLNSATGTAGEAGQLEGISHVLVTAGPDGPNGDPLLPLLATMLSRQPLQWLGYLSTTGVYGDTGGGWVDETSPTTPGLGRSRLRLESEQRWLSSGLPVQSFRLPAIYGPGRCPFNQLRQGTARLVHKPGQVFCRIHVDDIVGALLHCAARPRDQRPPVVNVSDDTPCPSSETLGYAAHLLGCKLPAVQRFDAVAPSLSPMALSFWADNRRVSNRLLCAELGYRLRYPSYREGFAASLREENASGLA
jgi:nucleoside-diphosphate-sugar epimerase